MLLLTTTLLFTNSNTLSPFRPLATQVVVKDNLEMVQTDRFGLIKNPFQVQYEKDKAERDKIDADKLKQKELEEQNNAKDNKEWQTFVLTFYTDNNSENGFGNITSQGKKLSRGGVANNVIPQNTKIYLEGYGEVVVNDKGSNKHFSVDSRLDVFIEKEENESNREYLRRVNSYGVKKVQGYIK